MRFFSSTDSFGDATEPPEPGSISSTLTHSTELPTLDSTLLSSSNKRYRDFYKHHTFLHQPFHRFNQKIQLEIGVNETIDDSLFHPSSIQSFRRNIHNFLMKNNSSVQLTQNFLHLFYDTIHPFINSTRKSDQFFPQMQTILGNYILFFCPSLTRFRQTLADLHQSLSFHEFHVIIINILNHNWALSGINDKIKIKQLQTIAASYYPTSETTFKLITASIAQLSTIAPNPSQPDFASLTIPTTNYRSTNLDESNMYPNKLNMLKSNFSSTIFTPINTPTSAETTVLPPIPEAKHYPPLPTTTKTITLSPSPTSNAPGDNNKFDSNEDTRNSTLNHPNYNNNTTTRKHSNNPSEVPSLAVLDLAEESSTIDYTATMKHPSMKNPIMNNPTMKNPTMKNLNIKNPNIKNTTMKNPTMKHPNPNIKMNPRLNNTPLKMNYNHPIYIASKSHSPNIYDSRSGITMTGKHQPPNVIALVDWITTLCYELRDGIRYTGKKRPPNFISAVA